MQAWRAKEKALEIFRGHLADSYSRLPSYLYILEKTYSESVVKLQKTEDNCFLPVVVVDGTFLKSAYWGIMLTASTMDATGSILPLAYAVVDLENDISWRLFFEQFKHAYGEKPNMCVVSDRNESILKATSTVILMVSGTCYSEQNMDDDLKHCRVIECGNQRCKKVACSRTIKYMRTLLERWTNEKLLNIKGYIHIPWDKIQQRVGGQQTLSQKMRVRDSTNYIHTVIDGVKRFIVCLRNKRCSCGQFQLDELPYVHALAALRHRNKSYENYCSPYYMRESLLQTYEIPIDSLPDESKWNVL
ncbi:uncharacterized protein [Nicotiana tomentosiformis]|uniref:uncharacterized protein n=1 Tax=Nicotiana tomentosiformis TaxID=4098 RepID=UPI00388C5DF6